MKYFDVVLATASPRRRELIKKIPFVKPVFIPANVDERVEAGALATARINAALKGEAVASVTPLPVLAFDTVVGLGSRVFGKPKDGADAKNMFRALCGNTHEVVTAVYLRVNGRVAEASERTLVTFGEYDGALIDGYIQSGAPFDKAGGYNIDDQAIKPLIIRTDGDYDNVVGLPVKLTEKLLEEYLNV